MDSWAAIDAATPQIADYALLGNCQGSALVSRAGSVDWACLPALDSPAFFARILGEPGGFWSIRPRGPASASRAYIEDTMVLQTRFRTATGTVMVTDFLPLAAEDMHNDIGLHSPSGIVRIVEGVDGHVELDVEIAIRPEYGLTTPFTMQTADGTWHTRGGPMAVAVSTGAQLGVRRRRAEAASSRSTPETWSGSRCRPAIRGERSCPATRSTTSSRRATWTITGWLSWAEKLVGYAGDHQALLRRSAVVLRALNYAPTGAIVAAPTTSLPEEIGGVRNWDYRYTWVRDASFTIGALAASGCGFEASRFFDFFTNATAGSLASGQGLQIMYGIRGERFIPEHELSTLAGHRGSRPVRIGNGAWDQTQLDVYGELLDAAWRIADLGIEFDAVPLRVLRERGGPRGVALAGRRRRHLGGARRRRPLPVLQADELGRARPRGEALARDRCR